MNDGVHHDSNYSSNQERVEHQHSLIPSVPKKDQSPYELLSECYSGYSFMRNKYSVPLKAPLISNVSSLQTTTDEAYESEATISPRSPTMSSSTAITTTTTTTPTTHVHPDLEHEFDYPAPPPPVPDRRLKPAHLRPPPPPTKPRYHKQQNDAVVYSKIQKENKTSPLKIIRHIMASTSDNPNISATRTLSSRHYCGSLPVSNDPFTSSSSETRTKITTDESSQRNSKTRSSSSHDNQQVKFRKSSSSSLTKTKSKKSSSAYFDETTNGLAIRLPASQFNEQDSTNKQNLNRFV